MIVKLASDCCPQVRGPDKGGSTVLVVKHLICCMLKLGLYAVWLDSCSFRPVAM